MDRGHSLGDSVGRIHRLGTHTLPSTEGTLRAMGGGHQSPCRYAWFKSGARGCTSERHAHGAAEHSEMQG